MRYLILILFVFSLANSLFSQEKFFDENPDNFLNQLKVLIKETGREELEELHKNLSKEYKEGKITENQQQKMVDVLNIMYFKKMQLYPYYRDFIESSSLAHRSIYDEQLLDKWYNYVKGILKNSKPGKYKDLDIFMDFSKDLFGKNCLSADKSKKWMITSSDITFSYIEGKSYVKIANTDIKGFYDIDTVRILNTSGVYSISDKLWKGTKGTINWDRVGVNASASFGEYLIDMNKNEFSIDSATLTIKEYFPMPIKGKLIDRITKKSDTEDIAYPQFFSYQKNFDYKNIISPNVSCSGGFMIAGQKVKVGTNDGQPVIVTITNKVGRKVFGAVGQLAIFEKGKYIYMGQSRVKLYASSDSITHPFSLFRYDVAERTLRINQEDFGSGRARFRSTFHSMSFDTEMLTWKIDSDTILLQNLVGKGKNATRFVSDNNFDQTTYNLARTSASENDPLSILSKMSDEFPEGVSVENFAKRMGPAFSTQSVLSTVFLLEKEGFLNYSPETKTLKINAEYTKFYLQANAKRKDYDLIRFNGYGVERVGIYNVKTHEILASNVAKIPVNDSSMVYIFPSDTTEVSIGKNRDIKASGKMYAGRMDIYGRDFRFTYDSFYIKSDKLDQMRIFIPKDVDPTTGQEKSLKSLKSSIDSFKGTILINGKFNKSGKTMARHYPKLISHSPSYIYYDHPNVFGGIYTRDSFKFEVSPFQKDSLRFFAPENLFFEGKLISKGIFPTFPEKVRIMDDLSLGFITQTPHAGLATYGNKGTFNGELKLSNQGLVGKGIQKHQSLSLTSDSILFFPYRVSMLAKKMRMEMRKAPTELPEMEADSVMAAWKPYSDSLVMVNKISQPFSMYEGAADMQGVLTLTKEGMFGKGYLDFPEAKIASNHMVFKSIAMDADTSSMEIKSIGNKVTFKTPNVRTKMDFARKIGEFKSNANDIATVFSENKYKAEINEFKWDMNKKILTFTSPPGSLGSKFTSIHPDQDSLFFFAQSAEYNMLNSVIKVSGADEIRIADSRVRPEEGKLTIFSNAKIQTLENAIIEGDTTDGYHIFDKCKLDIHGKLDMIGHGQYTLNVNNQQHIIKLHSIITTKKQVGIDKKKYPIYSHTIEGKGKIEQSQQMKLYRNVDFYGDVTIFMNQRLPFFKGMQRIKFINPSYTTPWFSVENSIDVESFQFINPNLVSEKGDALLTAFMIDRTPEAPKGLYTTIINKVNNPKDQIAMNFGGVVSHNSEKGAYIFGDSAKILGEEKRGNRMIYLEDSGILKAEGKFDPRLKVGGIPVMLGGEINTNLVNNTYDFKVAAGLFIQLDQRLMNAITNMVFTNFGENKDVNYSKILTNRQLRELLHPKDFQKLETELGQVGTMIKAPTASQSNIILTDLQLNYDAEDQCYRNTSNFGLSVINGQVFNKEVNGYFEMGYGEYQDFFNLYLKAKNREWLYITFSDGILGIVSSNEMVNATMEAVDPKKRYIRKNEREFYKYTLANNYEAEQFQKRMKAGGKFSSDEKEKYFGNTEPQIKESELKDAEKLEDKSEELKAIERENFLQDSLIQEMERKIALEEEAREKEREERNKMRKQKMEKDNESYSESNIKPIEPKKETKMEEDAEIEQPAESKKTEDEEKLEEPAPDTLESDKKDSKRESEEEKAPEKKTAPEDLFKKYF